MNNYTTNNTILKEPALPGQIAGTGRQGNIVQEVMHDSERVFAVLKDALANATDEILIATFWFTVPELFDIVLERLQSGVQVGIIIIDNPDNDKLPFDKITDAGGYFIRIKSDASVIMRQKFCIVDQQKAMYGHFNISVNALTNNTVSVTYTNLPQTVYELILAFEKLKRNATAVNNGIPIDTVLNTDYTEEKPHTLNNNTPMPEEKKPAARNGEVSHIEDFQQELTLLIETELNHFDRRELYQHGYTRSSSCGGDSNILTHSIDTVYYTALNDVTISHERKERLLLKISDLKTKKLQELDTESAQKQNLVKIEHNSIKEAALRMIKDKKAETEKNGKKIEHIEQIDIANRKKLIAENEEKIMTLRKEYIRPAHKLFDLIPLAVINGILLIYLILFYSSAAYILIYSTEDIQASMLKGIPKNISVFCPTAITEALRHGPIGFMFVVFFFILPVGFTLSHRFIDSKPLAFIVSNVIGLFCVDAFVALFISKAIQDSLVITNQSGKQWHLLDSFTDMNFYLVFVMGSMALLIFRYTYDRLMQAFSERNPTVNAQKAQLEIAHAETGIKVIEQQVIDFEKEKAKLELENIDNEKICRNNEHQLDVLPASEAREIDKIQLEYNSIRQHCEHSANMYINKVENNHSRISLEALKDRINTYLEGWNDFLHHHFSYKIATDKSAMATEIVNIWLDDKLTTNPDNLRLNN